MHKISKKKFSLMLVFISLIFIISCWDDAGSNTTEPTNTAPKWTKTTYLDSCKRGDTLLIDFTSLVVDAEEDSLTISKEDSTSSGTIENGLFTLAAPVDTTTSMSLNLIVSDGKLSDTATLFVRFYGQSNSKPQWTDSTYARTVAKGKLFSLNLSTISSDADSGTVLTYNILGTASGIDTIAGSLYSIIATDSTVSPYVISIEVSDGEFTDTAKFLFTFINGNTAPTWSDTSYNYNATKGELFSIDLSAIASDIDSGTILSYFILGASSEIDTISGSTYSMTALASTVSPYVVSLEVSDGELKDTAVFTFTLQNANVAPIFTVNKPMDLYEIEEGDSISTIVEATDGDSVDIVTLGIDTTGTLPNPETVTFTDGIFKWKSAIGESGSYVVTFFATDGKDTTKFNTTIKVGEANIIPTITVDAEYANGTATVKENDTLTVNFTFDDLDVADILKMSDVLPVVPGLSFTYATDSLTAILQYTPDYNAVINDTGRQLDSITIKVNDGEDSTSFTLLITVDNVNRVPVFDVNSPKAFYSVVVGNTLSIPFSATDADTEDVAIVTVDTSTFKTGSDVSVSGSSIVWNTTVGDVGTDTISLSVTDGEVVIPTTVIVAVNGDSSAPVITINGYIDGQIVTISETEDVNFTVVGTPAVAGDNVILSSVGTFNDAASFDSSTGVFSFNANYDMATILNSDTIFNFQFSARSGGLDAEIAYFSISVKVTNVNRAPSFITIPADAAKMIHENYSDVIEFTDPDGDVVTVKTISSLPELPGGLTYNSSNNTISGLIDKALYSAGDSFNVVVEITDGEDVISANWDLKVKTREWDYKTSDIELLQFIAKNENEIIKNIRNAEDTVKIFKSDNAGDTWGNSPIYSAWCETYSNTSYKTTTISGLQYANDSIYFNYSLVAGNTGPPGITRNVNGFNISGSEINSIGGGGDVLKYYVSNNSNIKYIVYREYRPMGPFPAPCHILENNVEKFLSDDGATSNDIYDIKGFSSPTFECVWVSLKTDGIVRKSGESGTWQSVYGTSFSKIEPSSDDSTVVFFVDENNSLFKSVNALAAGNIAINQIVSVSEVVTVKMVNENVGWLLDINGEVYFTNDGFVTKNKEMLLNGSDIKIVSLISATEDGCMFAQGENGEIFIY